MLRIRTILVFLVVAAVVLGGFFAGRASAQQSLPSEHLSHYAFPRTWGDFRTVIPAAGGYAYFFEASDGSIRNVRVGPAGLETVEVIQRSGTAPRSSR
jgi:hypothetical protein